MLAQKTLEGKATENYSGVSAATNNAASVATGYRRVHGYHIINTTAALKYVKLYDKATAPAPATDTALLKVRLGIPANGGAVMFAEQGIKEFQDGLGIAIVGASADNDNTAVAAGDVVFNVFYK